VNRETPEAQRRVTDQQIAWFDTLNEAGAITTPLTYLRVRRFQPDVALMRLPMTLLIGAAVAGVFVVAALLYGYRVGVVGQVRGQAGGPLHFLALAFVLAFALGALVTTVLTLASARHLVRDLD